MVFDSLEKMIMMCPKIENAATKLLDYYREYPSLLQKVFKYALDEKDMETRQRYSQLLMKMCKKLRPWFELELKLSTEQSRFARANLLKNILDNCR